ncbi:MAG: DUF4271 domain-containing protein [Bacteroidota bacterium]
MSSGDGANALAKPIVSGVKDTSIAPSLFKDHLLVVKNPKPEIHFTNYDYVISGVLLFLYILFVWMYVSNYKKLSQIINGFYINRNSNQMSRDDLSIGNRVSFFLSIFFIITLTIFISKVIAYYGLQFGIGNTTVLNIIIGIGIIVAYSLKFASIKLLGYILKLQREANDYTMTIFLFCNTLGLFMLPIVIGLTFAKQVSPVFFIYGGIGVIVTFFMVRMIRGLILGMNSSGISKIYLFMYLCTLEILPIAIVVKLFMLNVK